MILGPKKSGKVTKSWIFPLCSFFFAKEFKNKIFPVSLLVDAQTRPRERERGKAPRCKEAAKKKPRTRTKKGIKDVAQSVDKMCNRGNQTKASFYVWQEKDAYTTSVLLTSQPGIWQYLETMEAHLIFTALKALAHEGISIRTGISQ